MKGLASYYRAVLNAVIETGALLDQPSPNPQTLLTTAYRATEVNYHPPTRFTWNQIVSSGHLELLSDDMLAHLAEYFAFDFAGDAYQFLAESDYRQRVRRLIPIQIQQAIRQGCSDERDAAAVIIGFMPDCDLDVDADRIAVVAQRLHQDSQVRDTLNYQYSDVYSAVTNVEGLVVLVERSLAALGQPVGESPTKVAAP